jgi:hypothetical protein
MSVISPQVTDPAKFWSDLLELQVDSVWLALRLDSLSKDECVNDQKVDANVVTLLCKSHYVVSIIGPPGLAVQ